MYHPTTRLLTVLELLQSRGSISGVEIAARLEVDVRTVRRYIVMLQDMGMPVESERGRYGSYRLMPGFKLPPLMFNDSEMLALLLSLRVAKQTALSGAPFAIEGALAKIERALPETLRQQMQDIQETVVIELNTASGVAADPAIISAVSTGIRQKRQLRLRHSSFKGEITERTIDPYGLVYRVGRWYSVGYCHLRQEVRTFRLDRVLSADLTDATFEPPAVFNPVEHVEAALAATPGIYRVEVLFYAPLDDVRPQIPAVIGDLIEVEEGVLLKCFVQNLCWFAGLLAGVTLPMTILQPDALHDELRALITRVQHTLAS